jgi:photosystem II stability/assembly factor-like uncharacterized protein
MLKRKNLVKLIGTIGMLALPVVASAAGDICYLRDAFAASPTTAYLLCGQGMAYVTTDAGGHWTLQRIGKVPDLRASATMSAEAKAQLVLGTTPDLHAIAFRDDTHGIVVGNSGTIFATDDGGKTWVLRQNDKKQNFTTEHLVDVQMIGNQAWATGFDGVILHSIDGGVTWEKQTSGTSMDLQSVDFLNPDLGWAVGWSGTILRTTDGGKNWKTIHGGASVTAIGSTPAGGAAEDFASYSLSTVYFKDEKNGWACGFAGELIGSSDGGLTWVNLKSPVKTTLSSIAIDKSGRIWIAADDQLVVSEDGGKTWAGKAVNQHLYLSRVFGEGDSLWAMGELGLLKQVGTTKEWKDVDNFHPAGTFIADSLDAEAPAATPAAPATPAK